MRGLRLVSHQNVILNHGLNGLSAHGSLHTRREPGRSILSDLADSTLTCGELVSDVESLCGVQLNRFADIAEAPQNFLAEFASSHHKVDILASFAEPECKRSVTHVEGVVCVGN